MIEDLAKCNYRAPSETSGSNNRLKGNGVIELNRMTTIEAKLDALMNNMGNHDKRMHLANEVGTVNENEKKNSVKEGLTHEGPYQVEEGLNQRENNQGQRRSASFEEQMLTFMGENKKLLNIHEHKFADLAAFQANTTMFQANTNASLKNLETQVGQLALAMPNQSKDAFPSDTRKNLKDCMVVTLRSGREIESRKE